MGRNLSACAGKQSSGRCIPIRASQRGRVVVADIRSRLAVGVGKRFGKESHYCLHSFYHRHRKQMQFRSKSYLMSVKENENGTADTVNKTEVLSESEAVSISDPDVQATPSSLETDKTSSPSTEKELSSAAKKVASTFAPRSSTARGKNPAVKGSTLYTIFEVQAAISIVVGALLSFNVILPSDEPNIAKLMGMWMAWIITVPSLRARDCEQKEKDALNLLFVGIPLLNVAIPIFWKSFAAVYSADVVAMAVVYGWKLGWFKNENAESMK